MEILKKYPSKAAAENKEETIVKTDRKKNDHNVLFISKIVHKVCECYEALFGMRHKRYRSKKALWI